MYGLVAMLDFKYQNKLYFLLICEPFNFLYPDKFNKCWIKIFVN